MYLIHHFRYARLWEVAVPWRTTDLMQIREQFIEHAQSGQFQIAALCNAYGISEKTGHKWLSRYNAEGKEGLADRSRAPHESPNRVSLALTKEILAIREKHPSWGPKKIRRILRGRSPSLNWPAASTIGEILKREGYITPRPKRRSIGLPLDSTQTKAYLPNDVWSADFKGEFRLMNGSYCFPLTAQDVWSRYLIGTTALSSTASVPVEIAFARYFEEFGLPRVIRTDNGVPFATPRGLGRLSRLSVWWIKLGIRPERIDAGEPQQNGKHERMHKTLKAEATKPPGSTLAEQQSRLDRFRAEYNNERPHESLGQETPASCYSASTRKLKESCDLFEYPLHFEVRTVESNGMLSLKRRSFYLSKALEGEDVGMEEIEDGLWRVDFGPLVLGTFHLPNSDFLPEVRWKPDEPPPTNKESETGVTANA
jgi:transposase InsO family protein